LTHLKKYQAIYESWNCLNDIAEKYNKQLEDINTLLKSCVRKELSKDDNYPTHIAIYSKPPPQLTGENRCYILQMVKDLYRFLTTYQYEGRMTTDFNYSSVAVGHSHLLRDENQTTLVESTNQEDSAKNKLIAIYDSIVGQKDVMEAFDDFRNKSNQIYGLVNSFTSQVRILYEGIELGQVIKGKCSIGY
jgi:hypothetical protein